MFKGNTNGTGAKPVDVNSPDRLNRIVEGTSIKGEVNSESNIRIDGKLEGTITTKGRVVIGKTGHIEGEVICQDADIEGTLVGKITVNQLLTLKSTANISGDIITNKLAIEPGAVFSGSCGMADKASATMQTLKQSSKSENKPLEKTA